MKPGILSQLPTPRHIDTLPQRYHWRVYALACKVHWLEMLAKTERAAVKAADNPMAAPALAAVAAEYNTRGRTWPFSIN